MLYSSLTTDQQIQAAYLFADDAFGSCADAFDYEISNGNVIGRARLNANKLNVNALKPHTVMVNVCVREVPAGIVTIEMDRNANTTIQSIARNIAARLIQSQTVEA